MGACFNTRMFRDYNSKTSKEIEERWNDAVEQSLYEDGHSYSGGIGMLGKGFRLEGKICEDVDEADNYLSEIHSKWSSAIGVRFKDKKGGISILIGGWCSE